MPHLLAKHFKYFWKALALIAWEGIYCNMVQVKLFVTGIILVQVKFPVTEQTFRVYV